MHPIESAFLEGEMPLPEAVERVLIALGLPHLAEAVLLHGGLEGACPAAPRLKPGPKVSISDADLVQAVEIAHKTGAPRVVPECYEGSAFSVAATSLNMKPATVKKRFYEACKVRKATP